MEPHPYIITSQRRSGSSGILLCQTSIKIGILNQVELVNESSEIVAPWNYVLFGIGVGIKHESIYLKRKKRSGFEV